MFSNLNLDSTEKLKYTWSSYQTLAIFIYNSKHVFELKFSVFT